MPSVPLPGDDEIRELLEWEPPHGVLSVYLAIDHGERGGGWHVALKDGLREACAEALDGADHELKRAIEATDGRIRARFRDPDRPPEANAIVGFVEIAEQESPRDRWYESGVEPTQRAVVKIGPRPYMGPLVELNDEGRRRGVIIVSAEHARLLEWEGERVEEIESEEILTTGDWRERKANRPVDTAAGHAVSSSGRDQHNQRVEQHRENFIKDMAERATRRAAERRWGEVLAFGEAKRLAELEECLPQEVNLVHAEQANLIAEPVHEIAARLQAIRDQLNRTREIRLIERAENAAGSGGRGTLGLTETGQALAEARVSHLLLAAESLPEKPSDDFVEALALFGQPSNGSTAEVLIERALETGATVVPVEGEAADRLARHGGAAAILRY